MTPQLAEKMKEEYDRALVAADKIPLFTKKQMQTFELISSGFTNIEISKLLGKSIKTIEHHRQSIYKILEINSMHEIGFICAMLYLRGIGVLPTPEVISLTKQIKKRVRRTRPPIPAYVGESTDVDNEILMEVEKLKNQDDQG